jgi:hypothetical protein
MAGAADDGTRQERALRALLEEVIIAVKKDEYRSHLTLRWRGGAYWPVSLWDRSRSLTFQPLRGHQFVALEIRVVSGVETLSLRNTERGSFAVPRESQAIDGPQPLLFDASGALRLVRSRYTPFTS